jgi:hypothetical protein
MIQSRSSADRKSNSSVKCDALPVAQCSRVQRRQVGPQKQRRGPKASITRRSGSFKLRNG